MNTKELALRGKGAFHVKDNRNYQFNAAAAVPIDWTQGGKFNIPLIVQDQNGSESCVAQTTAEIAAIKFFKQFGTISQFSARYIYSQIFLANGGAYLYDGLKILTAQGIELEKDLPSVPESELHMRDKTGLNMVKALADFNALNQKEAYAEITPNIDAVAAAIRDNSCAMIGVYGDDAEWQHADVTANLPAAWGHAICGVDWVIRNGKKAIKFLNHWGNTWGDWGYGYLNENYFAAADRVMGSFVITDNFIIPTPTPMPPEAQQFINTHDKQLVLATPSGRNAIVLHGNLNLLPTSDRSVLGVIAYCRYRDNGATIPDALFDSCNPVPF